MLQPSGLSVAAYDDGIPAWGTETETSRKRQAAAEDAAKHVEAKRSMCCLV